MLCTHALKRNDNMGCDMRCGKGVIEYNPERLEQFDDRQLALRLKAEVVGRNLVRYIQWMLNNGRQEAIAHFASFFENATYPNANAFIMMDCREALQLINQMIANL